ncbi:MAG: DNA methylase [Bacteroidetes bacterium]|nr:DNA methylase [Bacteroidota bacterium]
MTKLKITYKPVADLIPYARNSRTHSDAQVAQIAASIREFGWTNPVLLDGDNGIIAGHGRVMAAQKLGETQVPTIELGHLNPNQKRAYIIADNKLALNAGWDEQMLALEIQDLKDVGYDLELLGFDLNELQSIDDEEEPQDTEGLSTDFTDSYEIIVECVGEFEQRKLLEDLTERGFKCKSLLR